MLENWNKAVLKNYFYLSGTEVQSIEEIPLETLKTLSLYSCKELYRPYICDLFERGFSGQDIARLTGLEMHEVRSVGRLLRKRK